MGVPKRPFVFYREIQNVCTHLVDTRRRFNVDTTAYVVARRRIDVEARSYVYKTNGHLFFIGKYKFYSCTQTAIRFFYSEIQNFKSFTQTAIRISHKEIRNLTIYH